MCSKSLACLVGLLFLAVAEQPSYSATVYNTTDTYSANFITVDLGNGDFGIYYAGHYTSQTGYPAQLETFTDVYAVIGGVLSSTGVANGPDGTISFIYVLSDNNVPAPYNQDYDFRSIGINTSGTGAYSGIAGSFTTYSRQFSDSFNNVDPIPNIPSGASILDFGTEVGLDLGTLEISEVPLPASVWLLGAALCGFGRWRRKELS